MLGWMILFALMIVLGTVITLANPAVVPAMVVFIFALLFVVGFLTRLVRGRAW
jgi:hypothetical protein